MHGSKIGHYRVLRELGRGGMGAVFVADDLRLGRQVALKTLVDADESSISRFRAEARALARVSHPGIVTVFSVEEEEGTPFLTMELLEGSTLAQLLAAGGLDRRRSVDIAIEIARALAAAHRHGIVHRDIKPSNVMVTADGAVKVLDFGLAKLSPGPVAADSKESTQRLTEAGTRMGTLHYMAPEQVRGADVDARADIFSFGVLLYELLSGRRPFLGETAADVISAILRDEPSPLSPESLEGVPAGLVGVVDRCLPKRPGERYSSADELVTDLEKVVASDGAAAGLGTSDLAAAGAAVPARPEAEIESTLRDLRTRLLAAEDDRELRRLEYEADAILESGSASVEARLLRDEIANARRMSTPGPFGMATGGHGMRWAAAASLVFVVSFAGYLAIRVRAEPDTSSMTSAPLEEVAEPTASSGQAEPAASAPAMATTSVAAGSSARSVTRQGHEEELLAEALITPNAVRLTKERIEERRRAVEATYLSRLQRTMSLYHDAWSERDFETLRRIQPDLSTELEIDPDSWQVADCTFELSEGSAVVRCPATAVVTGEDGIRTERAVESFRWESGQGGWKIVALELEE